MAFPFLPTGARLAAAMLIGAPTVSGLPMRAIDRAIVDLGTRHIGPAGLADRPRG